jgi:hypothetical protein
MDYARSKKPINRIIMKTIVKILAVLFLAGVIGNVNAHNDYTKVIKKEFSVNPDAQLTVDNSFGNVHCSNWDKNVIQIEVSVTVQAADESSAAKMFDKVDITINGSPSLVEAKTVIPEGGFKGNNRVKIDYMINMPTTINLDLTNKFGDIYISEVGGKGKINLGYGNIEAGKFSNSDNLIDIKFGNANIKSIKGAVVNLRYSKMELGYAGSLRLDTKYSDLDAVKIISLVMSFEGGKLHLEDGSVIDCKSKFSDLNITRLDQSLALDIQYGNCDIDEMPAGFTSVNVKNKYGSVNIGLPQSANYTLDAELKFCDLDFPEDKANITQRMITNTSKSYKATVGKDGSPASQVFIRSEFGNVSLE